MSNNDKTERYMQQLLGYQSALRAYIHAQITDWHAAEDVLQETNVVILKKMGQFREGTFFKSWIFTIAFNQVRSSRLKLARQKDILSDHLAETLADQAVEKLDDIEERRHALAICYGKLSSQQQALMNRRYSDNRSVIQMAEDSPSSAGTIRQTLYRIRQLLADCIARRLSGGAQ